MSNGIFRNSRKAGLLSDTVIERIFASRFLMECNHMTKREIIDYIIEINRGAKPEFLAQFAEEDLDLYLEHLMDLDLDEVVLCA